MLVAVLWGLCLVWLPHTPPLAAESRPVVPPQYQRFFVHSVDRRSLPEKVFNLLGLSRQRIGRSFALLAGVTQYPQLATPQEQALQPAAEDLRHLHTYLQEQEFFDEIVRLQDDDVHLDSLRYFLEVYFPARLKQFPHSRFLFAYSGHGMMEGSPENPTGYLLQSTARNLQDKEHGIAMDVVRLYVQRVIEAGHHVLVLINACNSGAFLNNRPFGEPEVAYLPHEKGAHAITASGSSQFSWHNPRLGSGSVFFEKLLAGLGGQADVYPIDPRTGQRGDGIITATEIGAYLREEVLQETQHQQTPIFADLAPNRSLGSFFFLNRQRQVSRGTVPAWDPAPSTAMGGKGGGALSGPTALPLPGHPQVTAPNTGPDTKPSGTLDDYLFRGKEK